MRIVERWWNGKWGVMSRHDVVLAQLDEHTWGVWWWRYGDTAWGDKRTDLSEADARALVDRCIRWAPGPRSDWKDLGPPISRTPRWRET